MFWSKKQQNAAPLTSDQIVASAVREALPHADPVSVSIVTAVTGLLAAVAYADREFGNQEVAHLRHELARIHGFSSEKINAVADVLMHHALRLSTTFVPRFTRTLREELPEEQRMEVLDALLGMAAADGKVSYEEVVSLRNMSTALGLSQDHYNALQEKYRERLFHHQD